MFVMNNMSSSPLMWQVHIQNATLAGAVAMGTAAEFMITPYGALIVGFCMGIISTFGFVFVTVSLHIFTVSSADVEVEKRQECVLAAWQESTNLFRRVILGTSTFSMWNGQIEKQL